MNGWQRLPHGRISKSDNIIFRIGLIAICGVGIFNIFKVLINL
jgi:hypothetical protein